MTCMVHVCFVTSPVAGMGIVTHRVPAVVLAVTRMARTVTGVCLLMRAHRVLVVFLMYVMFHNVFFHLNSFLPSSQAHNGMAQ